MNKILSENEIQQFREEGAVFLKNKFEISWINKLKKGIKRDIKNPSPRFKSHTVEKAVPAGIVFVAAVVPKTTLTVAIGALAEPTS